MQPSHIDIAKFIGAVAATIAVTLLWVHRSKQQKVDRSVRNSIEIAVRLLLVHAVSAYLLCWVFSVSVNTYLIVAAVAYSLAAAGSWMIYHPDDIFLFIMSIVLLALVGVAYILKQFVLGFPERDLVCLAPPDSGPPSNDPPPRQSDIGIVVSTLRPMGAVELAGERFDATSESGEMIPVGTPIRVCSHRGKLYVVATLNTEETLSA